MTGQPVRVQRSRQRGWRLPPNTICVDRSTLFGNPAVVVEGGFTSETAVAWYRETLDIQSGTAIAFDRTRFEWRQEVLKRLHELRGHNLACWCRLDRPCHADVLLELANR